MYLKSLKINNFRKFRNKNNLIEFVDSKDQWGEYHSVFMPKTSGDGTFYISGADISKKNPP